jgi:trehalose 6-phosphate phosphatase
MAGPLDRLVAPLVADPRHGGIVCDIDGTLAPIAPTPERAAVLPGAVTELERLAAKYSLVACVTGRPALEARRMIPVEGVEISGNHGLEVVHGDEVSVVPQAARYMQPMHEALLLVENDGLLPDMGCRIEDKGVTFSIHFRGSPRPDHALRYLEAQIVPKLDRAGLSWRFGRMVLEVRPPVPIDKGSAIKRLRGRRRIDHLLYIGDDRTDLDAFREATIRIAVRSAEGPQELVEAADGCVDSPQQVVELLASL